MNLNINDNKTWYPVLAMIGLLILWSLDELIYHVKKGRVVIVKESDKGRVASLSFPTPAPSDDENAVIVDNETFEIVK